MEYPTSNANTCAPGYRRNWAASNASSTDFPEPVFPRISVCPTSESWRFTRNGVLPPVAAQRRGGLLGGKNGDGFVASPGQTPVIGRRSAMFRVETSGRGRFGYPCP